MDPNVGSRGSSSASMHLSLAVGDLVLSARTQEPKLGLLCSSVEFCAQALILSHILENIFRLFKRKNYFPEF